MNDKSVRDTSLWTSLVFNPGVTDVQKDAVRTAHHVVVAPNERIMSASVSYILEEKYGFARAAREERPVDADGRPIPLYSYPTLHYLDGLDCSTSDIFEFGAGHSTLWWAERARSVTSAETDDGWARHLRGKLPENTTIVQVAEHDLVRSLRDQEKSFDVIVVDCAANRYLAAAAALTVCLHPSSFFSTIARWYPNTADMLRRADLLEIDFAGFKPTQSSTAITSLFLRSAFRPRPRNAMHPPPPLGGKNRPARKWDDPTQQ